MAILAYEGLPGAGKSYEAMVTQIIPMLQKGRHVVCYIEGLNFERIAEASALDIEHVRQYLHPLTREDMQPRTVTVGRKEVEIDGAWIEKTIDNAFHVFDEAQNWWPVKHKATKELTQFVTEHRHRGIDVLLMGQSLKDIFTLWRRRVDQKFIFLKLTALGTGKRYRVGIYKGSGNDEFIKLSDKICKYDEKYFGTYSSHVSADTNTETYTDKRISFLNGTFVKFGIPLIVVMLGFGCWKTWAFFHPALPAATAAASLPLGARVSATPLESVPGAPPAKVVDLRSPQEKYFADLDSKYRVRLAGIIEKGDRVDGVVEWLDQGARVAERLSLSQLRDMGVGVVRTRNVLKLSLDTWTVIATMWPIEDQIGKASDSQLDRMRQRDAGGSQTGVGEGGMQTAQPVYLEASYRATDGRGVPALEPVGPMIQRIRR